MQNINVIRDVVDLAVDEVEVVETTKEESIGFLPSQPDGACPPPEYQDEASCTLINQAEDSPPTEPEEASFTPPPTKQNEASPPVQTEASSTPPSKIVNTSIDGSDVANAEPVDATFSIQDETNGFGFANATFDVGGNHETHHTEPSMAINNETFDATSELSQINPFENEQQCVYKLHR